MHKTIMLIHKDVLVIQMILLTVADMHYLLVYKVLPKIGIIEHLKNVWLCKEIYIINAKKLEITIH